jgi:hypothetical protein
MAHVHRVVILVGVGQHFPLETGYDLRDRMSFARKLFLEPARQLLR